MSQDAEQNDTIRTYQRRPARVEAGWHSSMKAGPRRTLRSKHIVEPHVGKALLVIKKREVSDGGLSIAMDNIHVERPDYRRSGAAQGLDGDSPIDPGLRPHGQLLREKRKRQYKDKKMFHVDLPHGASEEGVKLISTAAVGAQNLKF